MPSMVLSLGFRCFLDSILIEVAENNVDFDFKSDLCLIPEKFSRRDGIDRGISKVRARVLSEVLRVSERYDSMSCLPKVAKS